jgi:hypothetical protein
MCGQNICGKRQVCRRDILIQLFYTSTDVVGHRIAQGYTCVVCFLPDKSGFGPTRAFYSRYCGLVDRYPDLAQESRAATSLPILSLIRWTKQPLHNRFRVYTANVRELAIRIEMEAVCRKLHRRMSCLIASCLSSSRVVSTKQELK